MMPWGLLLPHPLRFPLRQGHCRGTGLGKLNSSGFNHGFIEDLLCARHELSALTKSISRYETVILTLAHLSAHRQKHCTAHQCPLPSWPLAVLPTLAPFFSTLPLSLHLLPQTSPLRDFLGFGEVLPSVSGCGVSERAFWPPNSLERSFREGLMPGLGGFQ